MNENGRKVLLDLGETKRKIEHNQRELVTLRANLKEANKAEDEPLAQTIENKIRQRNTEIETLREEYRKLQETSRSNPIRARRQERTRDDLA